MDETWILGVTVAAIVGSLWYLMGNEDRAAERRMRQLQRDMDVLETHITNFLMAWWKSSGNDDPALRWRLKVSMVCGKASAYAWRHCRRQPGGPMMVVVHSKYWDKFSGGARDRDNRIMDEALAFVEAAFKKPPTPISGNLRDQ